MSLLAEYRKSLKQVEVEELVDLYFFRPLGFALVKAIYRTNITPNQLTMVSLALGILGGVCYGFGHRMAVMLGATLYAVSLVLDCSDGQLARLKKNGTRLGRVLDGFIDYFVGIAVYLGIGIGLAPETGNSLMWWFLIAAAGLSNFFHSVSVDYYRTRFIDFVQGEGASHFEDEDYRSFKEELGVLKAQKGKVLRKWAIGAYLRYLNIQKKMTLHRHNSGIEKKMNEEDFYRRNKIALRFWTFLGSSTQIAFLIVTSVLDRMDIYFWGMIVVMNIWAAVMFVVQNRIDHKVEQEAAI